MRCKIIKLFVVAGALWVAWTNTSRAQTNTVNPGWDLLQTVSGTTFQGVPFFGVPLGSYDFDGTIGVQDVGNTDTIIQRLTAGTVPSPTISIQMNALQLETAAPTSLFGGPLGLYFITLQSVRGGSASAGNMTIDFGAGTFNSLQFILRCFF